MFGTLLLLSSLAQFAPPPPPPTFPIWLYPGGAIAVIAPPAILLFDPDPSSPDAPPIWSGTEITIPAATTTTVTLMASGAPRFAVKSFFNPAKLSAVMPMVAYPTQPWGYFDVYLTPVFQPYQVFTEVQFCRIDSANPPLLGPSQWLDVAIIPVAPPPIVGMP